MAFRWSRPPSYNEREFVTDLIKACREGHLQQVRDLLVYKGVLVDLNTGDGYRSNHDSPLSVAVERGNVQIMKLLFEYGARPDFVAHGSSYFGFYEQELSWSPLMLAAKNGRYEAAELLLQKGAKVDFCASNVQTPLEVAAENGHVKLGKLLLDNGAGRKHWTSALRLACKGGHIECAKLLLEHGTDIDHSDKDKDTPLACAARYGHTECTKLLLEKGADVHKQSSFGNTALMLASQGGHVADVQLLLEHDLNASSRANALYLACKHNHMNVAEVLIKNGTDVNHFPEKALKTLSEIIERKCFNIAQFLIQNGVVIDARALSSAIKARNPTLMSALLQNAKKQLILQMNDDLVQGAIDGDHIFAKVLLPHVHNVNVQLIWGDTALMEAAKYGKDEHMKLLLDHGALACLQNKSCHTALMEAAKHGNVTEVKLLLEHNLDASNRANALYLACQHNHMKVAKVLIKNGTDVNHFSKNTLSEMIERKHFDIAQLLIQNGVVIDARALSSAIEARNPTLMSALLQNAKKQLIPQMNDDLVQGAVDGDHNFAKLLLPYVFDINIRLKSGNTALMEVAKHGKDEHMKLLLVHGAQVNLQNKNRSTALMEAAKCGNITEVKLLLGHSLTRSNRANALYLACQHNHMKVAEVLIKIGTDVNHFPEKALKTLSEMIERKHFHIAQLLIRSGVVVDARALSGAIKLRNPTLVSALLQNAEEHLIEQMNDDLVQAAVDGDHNFAKVLLPHVLDVNVQLKSGNTALMEVAKCGKDEHVKLLLQNNAEVSIQDKNGCNPLMVAIQRGYNKCVEQLLTKKDIDLNLQDNKDLSALFYGVKSNSSAVVKMLLDKGADIHQETSDGKDILQFAHECHKKPGRRMIQMIQQAQRVTVPRKKDHQPQLTKAFQLLLPSAHEWHNIGTSLKLPDRILNAINGTDQYCLREMLKEWLSRVNPRPTWSSLAEAVEPFNPSIAKEIRQKYCSSEVRPTSEPHQSDEDQDTVEDQKDDKNDAKRTVENLEDSEDESHAENTEDPNNEEHFAAVEKAMIEKGTLKHTLSHGVMVGPARSGKSSLMSRLAGEMPSSTSPSTGVAEKVVQVVGVRKSYSIALGVHDTIWFKLLYDQEAIRLMKLTTQSIPSQPQQQPDAPITDSTTVTPPPTSMQSEPQITVSMEESLSTTEDSVTTPFLKDYTAPYPEGYIPPMEVFKAALQGKGLETLRQHFENSWSFYLTDTGGQVEFQELIPLLVSGPSVFFFTFRLDQDLNQLFTIEYHLPDGGRSKPYQSTLTVVEAILQTLASVASMGTFTYKGPQVKSVSLKPKMFIVGTHKDKLDPATADSEIKKIDQHLQKVIKPTSYYQEEIIQFASESQLIYTVNNFSEDDSDFMRIRSGVERVVFHSEFKVHFPTHWLIFSLVLRQEMIKDSIISYEQCFSIAQDCGITDTEEFDHALWFLHTKIGLIRHFPTPGLNDFVIRDPQILFDMVTKLIVNTFTFENAVSKPRSTEFEKKGIFTLADFLALQHESPSLLPPEKLLQLLENLQIIAQFQDGGKTKFFIPCVLAHSEESKSQSLPQNSDIPPLLITFKCGYCPKGLAGALIVYLLTNKMGSKFKWVLKTDQIFRNQVSFLVSSCDTITLKIHPTFLELIHSSARETKPIVTKRICNKIHHAIESGVKQVLSLMNFSSNATCLMSFYCQNSVCNEKHPPHPATEIVEDEYSLVLWCKKTDEVVISDLPVGYSMWLPEKSTDHEAPYQVDSYTKTANSSEVPLSHGPNRDDMKGANLFETSHPRTPKEFGLTSNSIATASASTVTSFHHEFHSKPKAASPAALPRIHHTTILEDDKKDVDFSVANHPNTPKQIVGHVDPGEIVGGCDWAEICRYLHKMDQKQIKRLGGVLGLDIFNLEKMKDLPDDMVLAWLRKEGKVTERCGDPLTWGTLVKGLEEIGQTGIASAIHKDKLIKYEQNQSYQGAA